MSDGFFTIFVAPLEWILRSALEAAFRTTGSYGAAILAVSLIVSVGVLPLYHVAEKLQDRERAVQRRLQSVIDGLKMGHSGWQLHALVKTWHRQNGYHPIYALRLYGGILIQLPFFVAAYRLLSEYPGFAGQAFGPLADLGRPDALGRFAGVSVNLLPFAMTAFNLASAWVYGKKTSLRENLQACGLAAFFLVLLYDAPAGLLLYWTCNNAFGWLKNLAYQRFSPVSLEAAEGEIRAPSIELRRAWGELCRRASRFAAGNVATSGELRSLMLVGLACASIAVFLFSPIAILSSGTIREYPKSLAEYLDSCALAAAAMFAIPAIPGFIRGSRFARWWSLACAGLSAAVILFVVVFPPNFGEMSNFRFENGVTVPFVTGALSTAAALGAAAVIAAAVLGGRIRSLIGVFALLLGGLVFSTGSLVYTFQQQRRIPPVVEESELRPEFVFSRKGKNVVVVVFDRFIGGFMPLILKEHPELGRAFSGFTWYSQALSAANATIGGLPGLMGGWEYAVERLDSIPSSKPILRRIQETASILPYNFSKIGFRSSLYSLSSLVFGDMEKSPHLEGVKVKPLNGAYTKFWLREALGRDVEFGGPNRHLLAYSILRGIHPWLRPWFYNGGGWRFDAELGEFNERRARKEWASFDRSKAPPGHLFKPVIANGLQMQRVADNWSTLKLLSRISAVDESITTGTFHFYHNDFSHEPLATGPDFEPRFKAEPIAYPEAELNRFGRVWNWLAHYVTDVATLREVARWIRWMKENGVYDNTRIIFVSDHGLDLRIPTEENERLGRYREAAAALNPLMLVKDFGATGTLHESRAAVFNLDTPAIAMQGLVDGRNPYTGARIESPARKYPFDSYFVNWMPARQTKGSYLFTRKYRIAEGDLFDPRNWKELYNGEPTTENSLVLR